MSTIYWLKYYTWHFIIITYLIVTAIFNIGTLIYKESEQKRQVVFVKPLGSGGEGFRAPIISSACFATSPQWNDGKLKTANFKFPIKYRKSWANEEVMDMVWNYFMILHVRSYRTDEFNCRIPLKKYTYLQGGYWSEFSLKIMKHACVRTLVNDKQNGDHFTQV